MRVLKNNNNNIELFFLTKNRLYNLSNYFDNEGLLINYPKVKYEENIKYSKNRFVRKIERAYILMTETIIKLSHISKIKKANPLIIQVSDVREIIWGIIYSIFVGCKIIYDAHEDYFNQIYEYSEKTIRSKLKASFYAFCELIFLRYFNVIFCTDDYLLKKYSKKIFGIKEVKILRNYPLTKGLPEKIDYLPKTILDLVYIGSVNKYRGLIECAKYVSEFNKRFSSDQKSLRLSVYSDSNPLIADLVRSKLIRYYNRLEYLEIMQILTKYDVGICMWLRIKKFERNLPLKNFDYMAVGLPIITSNFGNLAKYARESGSAFCINPQKYEEFEDSVLKLFNPKVREELGQNGISYTRKKASFEVESSYYIKTYLNSI